MLITARRVQELGLLVAIVGALIVAAGGIAFLRSHESDVDRRRERRLTVAGSVLMAIGFGLQLAAEIAR